VYSHLVDRLNYSLVVLLCFFSASCLAKGYMDNPAAEKFITRMTVEHDFDSVALHRLFSQAEKKQSIIDAMNRPAEKVKSWAEYRKIFYTSKRISEGERFWQDNLPALQRAEKKYGVDPAIIVAIIGVETFYGRNKGRYRVIDALSTLAFDYPKRSKFFTQQLEEFLLLAREQNQNPMTLKGSYAGAMGFGQFIPSSYRSFAVDFDDDGFADIWNNTTDAIGSVANYFAQHKWIKGDRVATRIRIAPDYDPKGLSKGLKPEKTVLELSQMGYLPAVYIPSSARVTVFRLEGEKSAEFWFGLDNFYVITRYNHSKMYAMAVYQVSEAVRDRMVVEQRAGNVL
jgi:membrane-bound lytic murein transglycosylase B